MCSDLEKTRRRGCAEERWTQGADDTDAEDKPKAFGALADR